jgi:hypothetical protein
MSSSNFSSIPSVIELQQVRARNEFRWKKFGTFLSLQDPR